VAQRGPGAVTFRVTDPQSLQRFGEAVRLEVAAAPLTDGFFTGLDTSTA